MTKIPDATPAHRPAYMGSVGEHMGMAKATGAVLEALCERVDVQEAAAPILCHPDLHKRSIFVSEEDPTQITAIIDWQSCSIEPGLHYFNETPDLCLHPNESDAAFATSELAETQLDTPAAQKLEKDVFLCRQTWEVGLRGLSPNLFAGRLLDEDILRMIRYCHAMWKHGSTAFRDDLLAVHRRWNSELGMSGHCPYQPSPEELERHPKLRQALAAAIALEQRLQRALGVGPDGWVPIDR